MKAFNNNYIYNIIYKFPNFMHKPGTHYLALHYMIWIHNKNEVKRQISLILRTSDPCKVVDIRQICVCVCEKSTVPCLYMTAEFYARNGVLALMKST